MEELKFGYKKGVPEDAKAAWGCRAIVTQDGMVDVVPDRVHLAGDDPDAQELLSYLMAKVEHRWIERAAKLLYTGVIHTRVAGEHVLFEDDQVVVKGNTNASAGYLYVCAYMRPGE